MHRSLGTVALALFVLIASPVLTRELEPLAELPNAEESYPFVRCAALNAAALQWTGEKRLPAELAQALERSLTIHVLLAAALRHDAQGGDIETIKDKVIRDAKAIVALYVKRFEENYAFQGEAWAADSLVKSDFLECKKQIERAEEIMNSVDN